MENGQKKFMPQKDFGQRPKRLSISISVSILFFFFLEAEFFSASIPEITFFHSNEFGH